MPERLQLHTDRPMNDMETLARRTLVAINPNLAVVKFQTFAEQIGDRFSEERMIARLTMLFGGLALLLATIGLYGVTSYTVARTDVGDRHPHGAGGGARQGDCDDHARGVRSDLVGAGDWSAGGVCVRAVCEDAAV